MNILQTLNKSVSFVEKATNQSKVESKIEAEYILMYVLKIDKKKLYERYNASFQMRIVKKLKIFLN